MPDAELDTGLESLAHEIVSARPETIALGKRAFYRQRGLLDRDAYEVASGVMCENAATADAREGIAGSLEKRRAARALTEPPAVADP